MVKKKDDEEALEKLMKLTKLMKKENVRVAPKGPPKASNKWRSQDPKFAAKPEKAADVVEAGGMDVDPARREEYENWRKDKLEEANTRRVQAERKFAAAKKARAAQRAAQLKEDPDATPL